MDPTDRDDADADGSVTRWIGGLKGGDDVAANALAGRYFDRLVRLARRRLAGTGRPGVVEDEEDAALSAFHSLCQGLALGRFPDLGDRDDLWRLLVVITARKVSAQIDRRRALKRGGDWTAVEASADASHAGAAGALAAIASTDPTPELAAQFAEETRRRLDQLGDDTLRQVALLRLEGNTSDEIADQLGCARRTVARKLDLIRQIWSGDPGETPE